MPPDDLLLAFLAEQDTLCPICRYNLRGLQRAVCPECAAPLNLAVASPNLHLGPFVLMIVSFSLAAGFDLVVAVLMGTMMTLYAKPAAPATWIAPALVCSTLASVGVACLTPVFLLVRRRHRWNRVALRKQWKIAIATFLGVGIAHAALGGTLIALMG